MAGFTGAVTAALLDQRDAAAAAMAICEACVQYVPVTGAGVTLMSSVDMQEPLCATDEVASRIDEVQFGLADGPCVDAYRSGQPVMVADITHHSGRGRWPLFAAEVSLTGARGMYALPLRVGVQILGVLDCYRTSPGELGAAELSATLRAADGLVLALLSCSIEEGLMGPTSGTADALLNGSMHRPEVHQATGMITEQAGVSVTEALALLRAAAFATGRPIEDLALDVLARRYRFDPDNHDDGAGGPR